MNDRRHLDKKLRSKNFAVGALLLGFVLLIFVISFVKMQAGW